MRLEDALAKRVLMRLIVSTIRAVPVSAQTGVGGGGSGGPPRPARQTGPRQCVRGLAIRWARDSAAKHTESAEPEPRQQHSRGPARVQPSFLPRCSHSPAHLTSPHLPSPPLPSPHLPSPPLISPHVTSPHVTPLVTSADLASGCEHDSPQLSSSSRPEAGQANKEMCMTPLGGPCTQTLTREQHKPSTVKARQRQK